MVVVSIYPLEGLFLGVFTHLNSPASHMDLLSRIAKTAL